MKEPDALTNSLMIPLEVKALLTEGSFSGYAALFGEPDSQNDQIRPGAFSRSLAEYKSAGTLPPLLWMHDASKPIGSWQSIREDTKGLRVEGQLTLGTAQADEAYALMQDGAVTGLSIGYRARQSHQDVSTGTRVLMDVDLKEISLVALPANAGARVDQVKEFGMNDGPVPISPAALCREIEARCEDLTALAGRSG